MGRGRTSSGEWSRSNSGAPQLIYQIGIYGWRKRCLYVFILLLMVTVIINIALTVWILKVMDFNIHGMGKLRISEGKVRVEGQAEFLQALRATQLMAPEKSSLTLESSRNITLNARDKDGIITNKLVIGDGKIETYAKNFIIKSTEGDVLFTANNQGVELGAERISVGGSGGATFRGSVQTPVVRSGNDDLKVESLTRGLYVSAPERVDIRSDGGPTTIHSANDVRLHSANRGIILDAGTISLHSLPVATVHNTTRPRNDVYQLCVCKRSGRLFRAMPHSDCTADDFICD